jgi:hypothetical protein
MKERNLGMKMFEAMTAESLGSKKGAALNIAEQQYALTRLQMRFLLFTLIPCVGGVVNGYSDSPRRGRSRRLDWRQSYLGGYS